MASEAEANGTELQTEVRPKGKRKMCETPLENEVRFSHEFVRSPLNGAAVT